MSASLVLLAVLAVVLLVLYRLSRRYLQQERRIETLLGEFGKLRRELLRR